MHTVHTVLSHKSVDMTDYSKYLLCDCLYHCKMLTILLPSSNLLNATIRHEGNILYSRNVYSTIVKKY